MGYKIYLLQLVSVLLLVIVCPVAVLAGCPPDINAYWSLDESAGTVFSDSIGTNQALCQNGCPAPVSGLIKGSQDFSSVLSDLQIVTNQALSWASDADFSIEFWIKSDAAVFSGREAVVSRYAGILTLWCGLGVDGRARVELTDFSGNSPAEPLTGGRVLTDGKWHHMVLVRDAANARTRLYVDGTLEDEQSFSYSDTLGLQADLIGIGWNAFDSTDFWSGELDEVAMYGRALSSFEIAQHHTDGLVGLQSSYCDSAVPVRIMPVGDSVTAGYNSVNWDTDYMVGYRQKLYLDLISRGYQIDFVGGSSSGQLNPPVFDYDHEGHGGWSEALVAANVFGWLQDNPSDIVLLHVGTNFIDADANRVAQLLDEIDRYSEDVVVVLAKIINKKVPDPDFTLFNQNVEAMATVRIQSGDKIIIVDHESALDYPDDMDDELHPYQSGYEKMADVWRIALETLLPVPAFSLPQITSPPKSLAFQNYPYTYRVLSEGMPPPVYKLLEAPTGMTIDENSGRLIWTPDVIGQYPVTIEAKNTLGVVQQEFQLTVSENLILDTGDPGTSSTGSWSTSSGPNPYGDLSLWSRDVGSDYSFQAPIDGPYEVSVWWTEWSSRCTAVPVEIYDGDLLLASHQMNQQVDGGQWNSLGVYGFSGTAKIVILSESTECSTNSDAVQFVPTMLPALDFIEVEGPTVVNKNSSATYTARAVYIDGSSQTITPNSWSDNSVNADISPAGILTTFDVDSDQPCQLTASYTEDGVTRIATFDLTILNSMALILDTGDAGTSSVGTWSESSGPDPYGSLSLWSRDVGVHYDYQALLNGTYETALWWTEWSSRCTAVPVEIYDDAVLLDRVLVDQRTDGGQWNALGTYTFSGVARVSIVSESADCSTNADAVQFAPAVKPALDRIEIEGPLSVNKNSTADYSVRAFYVDGSSQIVTSDSWSDDSVFADISQDGVLTTLEVSSDQACQLSTIYTENSVTRMTTFDLTIVGTAITILDTGDSGTSFSGTWSESSGADPYETPSLWSRDVGVNYTYQAGLSGDYDTSLWWTEWSSRCTAVPVEIYDGNQLLDRVLINQQVNGGQWNSLGVYNFAGTARVVILSESAGCSTNVDAVQFSPGSRPTLDYVQIEGPGSVHKNSMTTYIARAYYIDGSSQLITPDSWSEDSLFAEISAGGILTALDVTTDQSCQLSVTYTENMVTRNATFDLTISSSEILILDTSDPGTTSVGSWEESGGANPYGALSLWSREIGANYSFESSVTGQYQVDLWWTEYASRCTSVTVEIYDGSLLLDSVAINQQSNGGQWNSLGQFVFSGIARAVILSESTACSTNADAFRLMPML